MWREWCLGVRGLGCNHIHHIPYRGSFPMGEVPLQWAFGTSKYMTPNCACPLQGYLAHKKQDPPLEPP